MVRHHYVKLSDLGPRCAIDLPCFDIECLARTWGNKGDLPAWIDIQLLVERFFEELSSESRSDDVELTFRWNHLLMAIGNFKRQGGTKILPVHITTSALSQAVQVEFYIPHNGKALRNDDQSSNGQPARGGPTWNHLKEIAGIGVPTATTLLSALWPRDHVILDQRDVRAVIGLGVGSTWSGNPLDDSKLPSEWNWDWYRWLRESMKRATDECGFDLVQVERALYKLDQLAFASLEKRPGKWKWSEYRPEALQQIRNLC